MRILIDGQTLNTPEINRGIGRYFINVIEKMLVNNFSDDFFITSADEKDLEVFSGSAQSKLQPLISEHFSSSETSKDKYAEIINSEIKEKKIDLYWNPNPLMINVFLPKRQSKAKFAATIYDLIPLVMKSIYLDKWPEDVTRDYYERLEVLKKDYQLFLHISKNTRDDFVKFVKSSKSTHIITPLAVQEKFTPDSFPKTHTDEAYILYTGGFDPRKNMFKAIEAYSNLKSKFSKEHNITNIKLCIVCALEESARKQLYNFSKTLKVEKDIILTGYIDDDELVNKYKKAQVFFFPSLYEGFGLPVLEALASGIPVACSDNSSMPEIGQKQVHYFNAADCNSMAKALLVALKDPHDYVSRMKRYQYSQQFSWNKTAQRTILAFHNLLEPKLKVVKKQPKETIAWLSPLPPQESGIANYSYCVLQELKKYADIHLYCEGSDPLPDIKKQFKIFPISEFRNNYKDYDKVYYHIGNSPKYHTNIYKLAWELPGIVVLHDYNIQPFLEHAFLRGAEKSYFYDSLTEGYNLSRSQVLLKTSRGVHPTLWQYPMSHALVGRSKKAIVHSLWVKNQFDQNEHIKVIPHFAKVNYIPKRSDISNFLNKYNINNTEYIVAINGFINFNKLPQLVLEAVNILRQQGYPIRAVLAGELSPELSYLKDSSKNMYYLSKTIITGYLEEKDYFTSLFAADLIVNLRNPTMGESSGTLMQALAANKVSILSNLNQYRDFPDNVCPKINHDGKTEAEQLVNIIKKIFTDPQQGKMFQENIKEFIKPLSVEEIAKQYLEL